MNHGAVSTSTLLGTTIELNKCKARIKQMHNPGTKEVMNGIDLEFNHIFGLPNVKRDPYMLFYTSETTPPTGTFLLTVELLIIPTGRKFVGYDTQDLSREHITGSIDITSISVIAGTRDGQLIALGEKQENLKPPRIIIYSDDGTIILTHVHLGGGKMMNIEQVAVSSGMPKYCLSLVHVEDEMYINYFQCKDGSLLQYSKFSGSIKRIAFNPTNSKEFVACGSKYLRYYKITSAKMIESGTISNTDEHLNDFIDAQFFPNTLLLLTISLQLTGYLIQGNNVKYKFALTCCENVDPLMNQAFPATDTNFNKHLTKNENKFIPQCFSIGSTKFAIGWKHKPIVTLYDIQLKDSFKLLLTKVITLDNSIEQVFSLQYSESQKYLSIAGQSTKTECFLLNIQDAKRDFRCESLIPKGNLLGQVIGVDASVSKGLIGTIGSDQYIRIWSFINKRCKQVVNLCFKTDLNAIAMHPVGHQLAIGTNEGIRLFFIVESELLLCAEISGKRCMAVQYSNGGHWLAAGFFDHIFIIDPNTFETKFILGSHRSTITNLTWTSSDHYLTSSCKGGTVFVWSTNFEIHKSEKTSITNRYEYRRKGVLIAGAVYDDEYDLLVIIQKDRVMEILSNKANNQYLRYKFEEGVIPVCLWLSKENQVLMVGTSVGIIRYFLWPPANKELHKDYFEYHDCGVHVGEITGMKVVNDNLFTSSIDSTVGFLEIVRIKEVGGSVIKGSKLGKVSANMIKVKKYNNMDSLALGVRSYSEVLKNRIEELRETKKHVDEVATDKQKSLQEKHDKEIADLKANQAKELEEESMKYKLLEDECLAEEKKIEDDKRRIVEEFTMKLEGINEAHIKKQRDAINLDNEKAKLLAKEEVEFNEEVIGIHKYLQDQLDKVEGMYKEKHEELKTVHNEVIKETEADRTKFESVIGQTKEEYEKEINNTKNKFNSDSLMLQDNNEELKKDLEKLERDLKESNKSIEEIKEQKDIYASRNKHLNTKIQQLELRLEELKKRSRQEEILIQNREHNIRSFKQRKKSLEKHTNILDNETELLKDTKLTMERQIHNLEDQITMTYSNLKKKSEEIQNLFKEKKDCESKLEVAANQLKIESEEYKSIEWKLGLLQSDLRNLIKGSADDWPNSLPKVYSKYFSPDKPLTVTAVSMYKKGECLKVNLPESEKKKEDEAILRKNELIKQNECLEYKFKAIKNANNKSEVERMETLKKLQHQNAILLSDANKLQRCYGDLQKKVRKLEEQFSEVTGISLTKVQNVEREVKKYMHPEIKKYNERNKLKKEEEDFTEETLELIRLQVVLIVNW